MEQKHKNNKKCFFNNVNRGNKMHRIFPLFTLQMWRKSTRVDISISLVAILVYMINLWKHYNHLLQDF